MNNMILKLILKRFFSSLLTLFLLVSFLFIIIRLAPGDPADKYVSPKLSIELSEKISEKFSLNKPIIDQYFSFISNAVTGELGVSYNFGLPVFTVIWQYFSFTFFFATLSFVFQLIISIYIAIAVVKKQNRLLENGISNIFLFIYSIPTFVLGVALIYLFAVHLNIFPLSGLKSMDYDDLPFFFKVLDRLSHLTLPIITITASGVALFYKYVKESMDEVLQQTFITNLRASGVSEKQIFKKHIILNSLRPLISVAGVEFGMLLGGTLITEVIFSLPGMGRLTVDSIFSRDYPLIIGCVFTAAMAIIISNFLADLIKLKIDKRLITGILN